MDGPHNKPEVFAALRDGVRHFLDDDFDPAGFARLAAALRSLPLEERRVAYEYLLRETLSTSVSDEHRARAVVRLADLVGREPPEIGNYLGPQLEAASELAGPRPPGRPRRSPLGRLQAEHGSAAG